MTLFRHLTAALLGLSTLAAAHAAEPPSLQPYQGQVTYVDFWASWCGPCAESFPWLNLIQARYAAQGLKVVGVGLDTSDAKADRFLKSHLAQFPIVRDPEGQLAERYAVEGMPYSVLIDAQGKVIHRHSGFHNDQTAEYEAAIQQALAAAKGKK